MNANVVIARSNAFASANAGEVSGQSAFWALVPIALNSMTQPAGSIFAIPSIHEEFGLRASPLVCVCDALHFLVSLTGHITSTRSPREAMRRTLQPRFLDWNLRKESSVANLQRNVLFRLILFTLGCLPQIIKLFCMRGIPIVTTIAAFYLSSFLVLETGVYRSSRLDQVTDTEAGNRTNNPTYSGDILKKDFGWKLRYTACPFSLIILFYPFALSAYEVARLTGHFFWLYAFGFSLLTLLPAIHSMWLKGDEVTLTETTILFPITIGLFLSSCLLLSILDRVRSTDSRIILGLWISAGLLVIMGIGTNFFYWVDSMTSRDIKSEETGIGWSLFTIFYHLSTALPYYAFRYDSSGTFKPLWVNQLG